jgi:hypothetical protein
MGMLFLIIVPPNGKLPTACIVLTAAPDARALLGIVTWLMDRGSEVRTVDRLLEFVRMGWHNRRDRTKHFNFTVSINTDLWFIKEPQRGQELHIVGARSSTEERLGSSAAKKERRGNTGQTSWRPVLRDNSRTKTDVHSVLYVAEFQQTEVQMQEIWVLI